MASKALRSARLATTHHAPHKHAPNLSQTH